MAEYLGASSTRRTSIIREARFPKTSIVAQYDRARDALVKFLTDRARSLNHLATATDQLGKREARPTATEWVKRDCRFSIEAIEAFQRGYNRLGLPQIDCLPKEGRQRPLTIGPTRVSVSLDVITRQPVMRGADNIGGAVFLFSRGERSTRNRIDRCKTIAGLAYQFARERLTNFGEIDRSICFAIDVFAQKSYGTPGTFVRKLRQIEHACEEIAARWNSINPPGDYDGPEPK